MNDLKYQLKLIEDEIKKIPDSKLSLKEKADIVKNLLKKKKNILDKINAQKSGSWR